LTAATINGRTIPRPNRCETHVTGTWGIFELDDPRCATAFRPTHWDRFEDKVCHDTKRLYSSKILDTGTMRWEDACARTPADVGGDRYTGPSGYGGAIGGRRGEFEIAEAQCSAGYRPP